MNNTRKEIPAIKVPQWLEEWNSIQWSSEEHRAQPEQFFYIFSMPAAELRALAGVYPRSTKKRGKSSDDLGIQRRHNEERSKEISHFIRYGYPWSSLSENKRQSQEFNNLRKPGWLPTAIIVNILKGDDERRGKTVSSQDLIEIEGDNDKVSISLPQNWKERDRPTADTLPPIEVIDGQHRLWAFDEDDGTESYHLPVVAFHGLDLSWQAYLFYTINIKPKRINASLAFDMYPLLRTEDWLQKFEGHAIYRETRAQEIVDLLWSSKESPWHRRINMLGESGMGRRMVSQAAWVRSLLASFIKSWENRRSPIGGLFGSVMGEHSQVLPWDLAEQAAFIIYAGRKLREAVRELEKDWTNSLREEETDSEDDQAFYGSKTLLNQDQGIRVFLFMVNDFCFLNAESWELDTLGTSHVQDDPPQNGKVSQAIKNLEKSVVGNRVAELVNEIATFDWRASDAPRLSDTDKSIKAGFRGSGGYRELRKQVLNHLENQDGKLANDAKRIIENLGLD